jgi:hypothetical protein
LKLLKKKAINYINNGDLVLSIVEWQKSCEGLDKDDWPILPDYIGKAILMIAGKLGSRGNFSGYSYRDEMVSDAIESCLKAVKNFDAALVGPKTGKINNAFNYLSMVAFRAMQRRIIVEKAANATKHKNFLHHHILDGLDASDTEVSNRIIAEFEEKHLQKKLTKEPRIGKLKIPKKKDKGNDLQQKANSSRSAIFTRPCIPNVKRKQHIR